jgi:multiple sugar transport system ATP-binding protein
MTLADKIVVLRDGNIEQVGEPTELYDRPQNLFVAGFIGSPPMNFFKAKVAKADGALIMDMGAFQLKVPSEYAATYDKYVNKDVTFGIRPEDIVDEKPEERRGIWEKSSAVVEVIEPLGAEIIMELAKGEHNFTARVDPHSKARLNQETELYFDMSKMHLFDPETEKVVPRG